jgi:hypothetical protein
MTRVARWRRAGPTTTCLLRTTQAELPGTLALILDVYGDDTVTRFVAARFTSASRRPLLFHLGQAELSFHYFRETARLLRARLRD